MATARGFRAPRHFRQKLLIQVLFLIILAGTLPGNSSEESSSINLHLGKQSTVIRISNPSLAYRLSPIRPSRRPDDLFFPALRLAKALKIIQYCSAASLVILLSGDVSPNPGWSNSTLLKSGLKIGHLNVRSLPKHLDELKIMLLENPFDIFCLNETWLNSSWRDAELTIDGYNLIRNDRKDGQRGGGTAIYYKSKFIGRSRPDLCSDGLESIWLEITFPNKSKILISSLYRPPNIEVKADFNPKLESLLDYACSEEKEMIVLGDLNCDLAAKKRSSEAKELCKLFNIYQFTQLIKDPTRVSEHSSTLIDLAFTTDIGKIADSGVVDCSISDHSLVYVIRRAKIPRDRIKTIKCRSFKTYSAGNFVSDLHSAPWETVDTSFTVEEAWASLNNIRWPRRLTVQL